MSHTWVEKSLGFKQVRGWLSTCLRHDHASLRLGFRPGLQLARVMERRHECCDVQSCVDIERQRTSVAWQRCSNTAIARTCWMSSRGHYAAPGPGEAEWQHVKGQTSFQASLTSRRQACRHTGRATEAYRDRDSRDCSQTALYIVIRAATSLSNSERVLRIR